MAKCLRIGGRKRKKIVNMTHYQGRETKETQGEDGRKMEFIFHCQNDWGNVSRGVEEPAAWNREGLSDRLQLCLEEIRPRNGGEPEKDRNVKDYLKR